MKFIARFFAAALIVCYLAPTLALAATATTTPVGQPSCMMNINPGVISPGGSAALSWSSINATDGTITGVGGVGPSGSLNILPPEASQTTFVGTFSGPGGTATCSAVVQVNYGTAAGGVGGTVAGGTVTSGTVVGGGTAPVTSSQLPVTSSATPGSLVPCGLGSDYQTATGCQACNLAQLVQNIINFAIGISIPIAAVLFAWAGILYFTSGADPHNKDKAKDIFKNAFIGFLIAISGWLIVNTILHTILNSSFSNGSWFTIQCSAGRQVSGDIGTLLNSVLPGVNTTPPVAISTGNSFNSNYNAAMSQFTPSCDTTNGYSYDSGSGQCINMIGDFQAPTYSSSPALSNSQMAQQLATACSTYNMDATACSLASAIAINESNGGNNCTTSSTGAAGCMQVLATTACSLDSSIQGCGDCLASRNSLSTACAPVIQAVSGNAQLGVNLGVEYINQQYNTFGSCQTAAAAYYAGPAAVKNANRVVSNIPTPNYPGAISPLQYATKACGN